VATWPQWQRRPSNVSTMDGTIGVLHMIDIT
jgi:hypothetical protein